MTRRWLIFATVVATLFLLGRWARDSLGIELAPDAMRAWVRSFGWRAPAAYLGLLTFRHFLLLPSTLVIAAGGLCFGALIGGALGMVGIVFTGIFEFGLLRTVKPAWLVQRAMNADAAVRRRVERGAPMAVAVSTAVPGSPMSAFHWAAAFTPVTFLAFLGALVAGAAVRSFALSIFGATFARASGGDWIWPLLALSVWVAVPLLHPELRRRLLG